MRRAPNQWSKPPSRWSGFLLVNVLAERFPTAPLGPFAVPWAVSVQRASWSYFCCGNSGIEPRSCIGREDSGDDAVAAFFRIEFSYEVPLGMSRCIICIPLCSAFCSSSCPTLGVFSSIRLKECCGRTACSCRSRGSAALAWSAADNCDWCQGMACWTWTARPCSLARCATTARQWHEQGWKSSANQLHHQR